MEDPTLIMWVWHEVLLEDMDDLPPVRLIEMVPHYASGTGGPWEPWEEAAELVNVMGEDDLI